MNRADFSSAIKRAATLSSTETGMIIVHFKPEAVELFGENEKLVVRQPILFRLNMMERKYRSDIITNM